MQSLVTARTVILDPAGRMLLVRRSASDPLAPGSWDLPGGRCKAGESFEQAALRETAEETGIALGPVRLVFATSAMRLKASKTWLFFTAKVPAGTSITLSTEHDDYQWIVPAKLDEYTTYDILLRFHAYAVQNKLFEKGNA